MKPWSRGFCGQVLEKSRSLSRCPPKGKEDVGRRKAEGMVAQGGTAMKIPWQECPVHILMRDKPFEIIRNVSRWKLIITFDPVVLFLMTYVVCIQCGCKPEIHLNIIYTVKYLI